jgi:hypothetical protein
MFGDRVAFVSDDGGGSLNIRIDNCRYFEASSKFPDTK